MFFFLPQTELNCDFFFLAVRHKKATVRIFKGVFHFLAEVLKLDWGSYRINRIGQN